MFIRALLCFVLAASSMSLQAELKKPLGLGFILGVPTALSAKQMISEKNAVDFGFGYSWGNSIQGFSDYLFLFPNAWGNEELKLTPYMGIGVSLTLILGGKKRSLDDNTDTNFITAARVPFGISWMMPKTNVEFFAELVPMLDVVPGLFFDFGGGLGLRIFI